jgi:hypothetical protein
LLPLWGKGELQLRSPLSRKVIAMKARLLRRVKSESGVGAAAALTEPARRPGGGRHLQHGQVN